MSPKQPALIDLDDRGTPGGPVYQGVCAQLRALFPARDPEAKARKDANMGTIAQARSLAASIDRVSGHGVTRQASGIQLAAMHERLDALLERLSPDGGDRDPFQELLNALQDNDTPKADDDRHAETPHPPV